jgi:predicted nucleic acid-binding Zn ribbon protein
MTYTYFCPNDNSEKEEWHGIFEEPEIFCDKCGQIMKHKITGGSGTVFKGYGWSRSGTKDSTQGKGKHTTETTVAVPVGMEGSVSNDVKKASKVKRQIGSGK